MATPALLDRILVPLDGSETADAILPQVLAMLKGADAEVILFQAVPTADAGKLMEPVIRKVSEDAEIWLERRADKLAGEGVRVKTAVRVGIVADAILAEAKKQKATLIAMSTHGRTGVGRVLLGSTAERVIRAGSKPVLVMKAAALSTKPWTVKRILLTIDGSEESERAVEPAIEVAQLFGATIVVVRVEEPVFGYGSGAYIAEMGPLLSPELIERRRRSAMQEARRVTDRVTAAGVTAERFLLDGTPANEIVELCAKLPAQLIVMATHGRSGFSRWILGSVTEKVLRAAPAPVLVVPRKKP